MLGMLKSASLLRGRQKYICIFPSDRVPEALFLKNIIRGPRQGRGVSLLRWRYEEETGRLPASSRAIPIMQWHSSNQLRQGHIPSRYVSDIPAVIIGSYHARIDADRHE